MSKRFSQVARVFVSLATAGWLAVNLFGMSWFWGGWSSCEKTMLALPCVGLVAALICFPLNRVPLSVAGVLALALLVGMGGAGAVSAESTFPCGSRIAVAANWPSMAFMAAAFLWLAVLCRHRISRMLPLH